jgi:nicotinamide-nucleotide amidase
MSLIKELLIKHHQTLSVVESMTGGMIASKLVSTSGISEVFKGGLICYQDTIKTTILGLEKIFIETYGVVSKEVSKDMAIKGNTLFKSSICVSVTGYAETYHMAYISISTINDTKTFSLEYKTLNRIEAIEFVSMKALEYLEKVLLSL